MKIRFVLFWNNAIKNNTSKHCFAHFFMHLCQRKQDNDIMKNLTIDDYYEAFGRLLLEDKVYLDPDLSFHLLCKWLGADEKQLDARVQDELGVTGSALMRQYRAQEPGRLREKYAYLFDENQ